MLKILKHSLNSFTSKEALLTQKIFSVSSINTKFNRIPFRNSFKTFSEKMKLKDRIKLVDYDDMEVEKEQWGELLATSAEKENISRFNDQIDYIKQKKIILTIAEMNKILQIIYPKYPQAVDVLHDWIDDHNLQMDSITYHFLIMSAIKFKGYTNAFNLFFRAHLFNIPQNLTVIITLCKELNKIKNATEKMKYKNFIQIHVKKFYSADIYKLLSTLNIEFEKGDELSQELGKFEDVLKKTKKLKKSTEEKKSINGRNPNIVNKRRSTTTKNSKENGVEMNGKISHEKQITKLPNMNEAEKEGKEIGKAGEQSDSVINSEIAIALPEELENNKKPESLPSDSVENKKVKKKGKDRKGKKNYDNTLDNIFGNGGIIVIAQSLPSFDESDSSDSE